MIRPAWLALVDGERRLPVRRHRNQPHPPRRGQQVRRDERATVWRPANQVSTGGISSATSSASSYASALASAFSMAVAKRSSSARASGSAGSASSSSAGSAWASWARARRSAAVHRGGRRAQQIRHLGGRPLQHVPQDQHRALPGGQVLHRRDEGQPDARPRHGRRGRVLGAPGQRASGTAAATAPPAPPPAGPPGPRPAPPSPDGSGRRPRRSIAVRHTLVAIRYSQVRTDARPSNPSKDRHARRYVSCTRSSASSAEPSIR